MPIIASQTFNALPSTGTFTDDAVPSGDALTNAGSFNLGGPGLDFETVWVDTRGVGSGPVTPTNDSNDFIGVNSFTGPNAPDVAPDGTTVADGGEHNFQFNDGDGRLDLTFEAIDLSGFVNRSLTLNYWIADTGFESTDLFSISVFDGSTTASLLALSEPALEAQSPGDAGNASEWTSFTVDLDTAIADAGLDATSLSLIVSADTNAGSENIFIDDVLFEGDGGTPPAPPVVINEIVVSTASTDREFVEFLGTPGTSLDGLSLLEVEPGGEIDTVIDLGGNALGDNGYFLAASPEAESVLGVTGDLSIPNNTFTNGSRTYLLVDGFSGASGDDIDTDDDGVIDTAPWTQIVDSVAPIDDDTPVIYSSNVIGPDGTFLAPGGFRDPEGTGAFQIHDFFDTDAYTPTAATQPATVVINAVLGSTTSTDSEYIELFGTPGASLDGLSLIVVESDDQPSNGNIDTRIDLEAGDAIGDNGFFLLANGFAETAFGVTANKSLDNNSIENSSYTLALVETSSLSGGAVTGNETVIDSVGVSDGEGASFFAFGAPVVGPDGSFLPAGVRRNEDGMDTDSATDFSLLDFFNSPATNTPTAGTGDAVAPPADEVFIHEVQGSGDTSPLDGQRVTVTAIVVGDFQDGIGTDGDLNGFFLQEEDADADSDAATSEGVFVFDGFSPSVDVAVGDRVEVTGTVTEFFGETQIEADTVTVLSPDNALPTAAQITFPVASTRTNSDGELIADLEAYEGMLVEVPQELTVSDLFTLGRFGDIGLHADGRLEQYTQANTPDVAGFEAYQDLAVRNSITLDDGSTVQNPDTIPFEIPTEGGMIPGQFDAGDDLNVGDTVTDLTGVLRFGRGSGGFGDEIYRLNPTDVVPFQNTNPREATPPETGGSLTVATFNVLNFFTTLDDEDSRNNNPLASGPENSEGEKSEPRGANDKNFDGAGLEPGDAGYTPDLTEFNRQLDKLMAAFQGMDADIYGLVEIENEIGDQNGDGQFAIEFLAEELNLRFGTNYQFADPGTDFVGSDAISVGFLYDADTVRIAPATSVAVLDDSVLPSLGLNFGNPVFDGPGTSRAPIAATFEELATGEVFTATTNHFKSKGSVSPFGNNAGIGDGAGNNNEARTQAAIALDTWLDTDPTGSDDEDFLILGDLNAYAMEDPLQTLFGEGYLDTVEAFLGPDEFSYSFGFPVSLDTSPQVQAFGSLDYALANDSLFGQVTGAQKWHINADEASALDYNIEFKPPEQVADLYAPSPYRSSDHDPVIVGLDLQSAPELFTLELLHLTDQELSSADLADIPRASGILNALDAQDLGDDGRVDNTLRLSSGDLWIPGPFYSASADVFGSEGIADIQIANEMGFHAVAFGNHEFDGGPAELASLIDGSAPGDFSALTGSTLQTEDFTGADFPYLAANLDVSTNPDTVDEDGDPVNGLADLEVPGGQAPQSNTVTSSVVKEVNGEKIGIVGAVTPTLAAISSPGTVGIAPDWAGSTPTADEIAALAAEIQAEVDALLVDPTLNKVILLSHMQQIAIEQQLAELLSGVDIIVAGGSNTRLFDDDDRIRPGDSNDGQYPQFFTGADENPVALVNTDGSVKYVGRLVIDFDANGIIDPDSYDPAVSGAYATDAQGVADLAAAGLNASGLIDPEIQAITDAIEQQIIASESNVFGASEVFLNGNRAGEETADDPDGVRTQETNLGNLTADANLAAAKAEDPTVVISLKNGGGIRDSIGETVVPPGATEAVRKANPALFDADGNPIKPAGGISQNDIDKVLAFNNDLVALTLTRAEIVDLLEHGVSALPGVAGQFPQIAGVEFSFDPNAPAGARIQSAEIVDADGEMIAPLVFDGEIVGDASATFRIVTLGFLAEPRFDDETGAFTGGGDGYPFPNFNTDPTVVTDEDGNGIAEVATPEQAARIDFVNLTEEGVRSGDATFADDNGEQDALAEYLDDNFNPENGGTSFAEADTGRDLDTRIQNLEFRDDDVFDFDNLLVSDGSRAQRFTFEDGIDQLFLGDDLSNGERQRFDVAGFEAGDRPGFDQDDILFSREAGPNLLVYIDNADRDSFVFRGVDSVEELFAGELLA